MKFNLNLLEQVRECTRKSEARANAMAPVLESTFAIFPPKITRHEHVLELTSSGFIHLASFEQFQAQISETLIKREFSHFAFRNSIVFLFKEKYMSELEVPHLDEESGMMAQVFVAAWLQEAWRCDETVALTMQREPVNRATIEGEPWVAFAVAAVLPCSEDEWTKCYEAKKMELEWADTFFKNRQALADVATRNVLGKFGLH